MPFIHVDWLNDLLISNVLIGQSPWPINFWKWQTVLSKWASTKQTVAGTLFSGNWKSPLCYSSCQQVDTIVYQNTECYNKKPSECCKKCHNCFPVQHNKPKVNSYQFTHVKRHLSNRGSCVRVRMREKHTVACPIFINRLFWVQNLNRFAISTVKFSLRSPSAVILSLMNLQKVRLTFG